MKNIEQVKDVLNTVNQLPWLAAQVETTRTDLFATFTNIPVSAGLETGVKDIVTLINKKKTDIKEREISYQNTLQNITDTNTSIGTLTWKAQEAAIKSLGEYRKNLTELTKKYQLSWGVPILPVGTNTPDVTDTITRLEAVQANYQSFYNFIWHCNFSTEEIKEDCYIGERPKEFDIHEHLLDSAPAWTTYGLNSYNAAERKITLLDYKYNGIVQKEVVISDVDFDATTWQVVFGEKTEIHFNWNKQKLKDGEIPITLKISAHQTIAWSPVRHEKKMEVTFKTYDKSTDKRTPLTRIKDKFKKKEWGGSWNTSPTLRSRLGSALSWPAKTVKSVTAGTAHLVWWALALSQVALPWAAISAAYNAVGTIAQEWIKKSADDIEKLHTSEQWWMYGPNMLVKVPLSLAKNWIRLPFKIAKNVFWWLRSTTKRTSKGLVDHVKAWEFAPVSHLQSAWWTVKEMFPSYDVMPDMLKKVAA